MARNLKYYGMDPASGPDRTSVTLYDWQTEYYIADPAINEPLPPKLADLINETMRKLSERAFYGTPFNDESPASCSDCPPEGSSTGLLRRGQNHAVGWIGGEFLLTVSPC